MTDDRREPRQAVPADGGRRRLVRSVGDRLIPPGGRSRAVARFGLQVYRRGRSVLPGVRDDLVEARLAAGLPYPYRSWLAAHRADPATLDAQAAVAHSRPSRPTVLVIALDNGSGDLAATRRSLEAQTWPDHRLEVVDGPLATAAERIGRLVRGADPSALVTIARSGDRFEPDFCFEVADAVWRDPLRELVSWDDDVDGDDPRLHGQWSTETLTCANPLGRSFAMRASTFVAAGGIDPDAADAGWWDLLLRAGLDDRRTVAVDRVLVHLVHRDHDVPVGGERVVEAWLRRAGWPARADRHDGKVRVEWELDPWPRVSIVIPSRSNHEMLSRLLPTLRDTDYPGIEVVIVDNSGATPSKEQWYAEHGGGLDLRIIWWDHEPFNFSAVNNTGAAATSGDVLVFLNDDTEALEPGWLRDLVGWASRPEIGVAGALLLYDDGTIQHAGVRMSHHGLADHYFSKLRPGEMTMAGRTDWTRGVSAVTGACVAVRRELFERIGGFDEQLVLTGNDVELSLDASRLGLRNVLSAGAVLAHHESVSRGHSTVWDDTFRSYWRFRHWVLAGDPHFSPHLRVIGPRPDVVRPFDPTAQDLMEGHFRRSLAPAPDDDLPTPAELIERFGVADSELRAAREGRPDLRDVVDVRTVNWVFSHIADPFDPSVLLALRVADRLARSGVHNRFVVLAEPDPLWFDAAVATPFPSLAGSQVLTVGRGPSPALPAADVAVAVTWDVAAVVAAAPGQTRVARLVVDDDAARQPIGTPRALAERASRLGLVAIADSPGIGEWYRGATGAPTHVIPPAVDPGLIQPRQPATDVDGPITVLVDVAPGHVDDCWELIHLALLDLKARHGDGIRLRTVGAWPAADRSAGDGTEHLGDGIEHLGDGIEHLGEGIVHLGVPDERSVGALYRDADIGLVLRTSRHPGRRLVELMGSGVASVCFAPPGSDWLVRDGVTAVVAPESVEGIAGSIDRLLIDRDLRRGLGDRGAALVERLGPAAEAALDATSGFLARPGG